MFPDMITSKLALAIFSRWKAFGVIFLVNSSSTIWFLSEPLRNLFPWTIAPSSEWIWEHEQSISKLTVTCWHSFSGNSFMEKQTLESRSFFFFAFCFANPKIAVFLSGTMGSAVIIKKTATDRLEEALNCLYIMLVQSKNVQSSPTKWFLSDWYMASRTLLGISKNLCEQTSSATTNKLQVKPNCCTVLCINLAQVQESHNLNSYLLNYCWFLSRVGWGCSNALFLSIHVLK